MKEFRPPESEEEFNQKFEKGFEDLSKGVDSEAVEYMRLFYYNSFVDWFKSSRLAKGLTLSNIIHHMGQDCEPVRRQGLKEFLSILFPPFIEGKKLFLTDIKQKGEERTFSVDFRKTKKPLKDTKIAVHTSGLKPHPTMEEFEGVVKDLLQNPEGKVVNGMREDIMRMLSKTFPNEKLEKGITCSEATQAMSDFDFLDEEEKEDFLSCFFLPWREGKKLSITVNGNGDDREDTFDYKFI